MAKMSVLLIRNAGKLKNAKMPKMAKKHRVPPYEFLKNLGQKNGNILGIISG